MGMRVSFFILLPRHRGRIQEGESPNDDIAKGKTILI